jgi:flagellar FliL protein
MFGKKKKKKDDAAPDEAEATPQIEGAEGGEGADGEAAPGKKKMSGKKLILFIVLPAILVLGAGGGAAFMLLGKGGGEGEQHAEADAGHGKAKGGHGAAAGEPIPGANGTTITYGEDVIFVTLPEMLVNVVGHEGRPAFLKLKLTLEAPDEAAVTALTSRGRRARIGCGWNCCGALIW